MERRRVIIIMSLRAPNGPAEAGLILVGFTNGGLSFFAERFLSAWAKTTVSVHKKGYKH